MVFLAAGLFWRLLTFWSWCPPKTHFAARCSVTAALAYAMLAGCAVPTQRALIMVAVMMLAACFGRHLAPSRTLALAALGVITIDPLADARFGVNGCVYMLS